MKNFFKKLSFVLALAMVLTSLYVPADASAAATNFVVTKHSGKSYSKSNPLYIYIGGFVQNLDYSINGKKSGVAGTWESSKPAVVDVDAKTGALTAKKLGSAVVTFTTKDGKTKVATAVKVRARAASAKFYVKGEDGTNTVIDSIDVEEGATAEVRVALPVNKKAKAAGATKSSYFVQETEVADTAIASVEQAGEGYLESRILTISGKTDGTTTLTITANSETKNAKYEKTAELTINVGSGKLTAEQAGANTIKVTGKNLTDVVADYVVKRGTTTVSIKSVALNDAKTEATLTAASQRLVKGDYTLSFKGGEPVEFKVIDTTVAKIVIDPETAMLKTVNGKASTNTAIAYYKVYNQYEEDITAKVSFGTNGELSITGSDSAHATSAGVVEFFNSNGYTPGLSQVSLAVVDTTNGVNVTKVLPIGAAAQLSSIEYVGLYRLSTGKTVTLTEGAKIENDVYFVYSGKDQYGAPSLQADALSVNVATATGVTKDGEPKEITLNGVKYIGQKIKGDEKANNGPSYAGTITLLAVNKNNGTTDSQTVDVVAAVKIDTITISADGEVYAGVTNNLSYTVLDTNGNEVTDYNVLKTIKFNASQGSAKFTQAADGSVKLAYTAPNAPTIATVSCISATNKYAYAQINVLAKQNPVAVYAVDAVLGSTVSGDAITLAKEKISYVDQYGNTLTAAQAIDDVNYRVVATIPENSNMTVSSGKDAFTINHDNVEATTTATLTLSLEAYDEKSGNWNAVAGSDYAATVSVVAKKDLSDFAISDIALTKAVENGKTDAGVQKYKATVDPEVYGMYNGSKVVLAKNEYEIRGNSNVVEFSTNEAAKEVTGTVYVVIDPNLNGTTVSKTFTVSNAKSAVTTISRSKIANVNDALAKDGLISLIYVEDQYGKEISSDKLSPFITISDFSAVAKEVNGNGTEKATITLNGVSGNITVKYDFGGGKTFTTTAPVIEK